MIVGGIGEDLAIGGADLHVHHIGQRFHGGGDADDVAALAGTQRFGRHGGGLRGDGLGAALAQFVEGFELVPGEQGDQQQGDDGCRGSRQARKALYQRGPPPQIAEP